MSEKPPSTKEDDNAKALSKANSVQPGPPAGEVPQSDPSPLPPPNAEKPA